MGKKKDLVDMGKEVMEYFKKEGMKELNKMQAEMEAESVIIDNKIEFEHNKSIFRVRKPNRKEQKNIARKTREKYTELTQDDSYMFEKQWVKILKKKGIDIYAMNKEIGKLQEEIKPLLFKMAQTEDKKALKKLKEAINKKRNKQQQLNADVTSHLEYCIESQTKIFETAYMASVVLEEQQEDDTWEKYFDSFEEYDECEDFAFLNKLHYYLSLIIYRNNSEE